MRCFLDAMQTRSLDNDELIRLVEICEAAIENLEALSPVRYGITINDLRREIYAARNMMAARATFDVQRRKFFDK